MSKAAGTTASVTRRMDAMGKQFGAIGARMQSFGGALTAGITAPLLAVGAIAAKTAISFESAFAGVRKTLGDMGAEKLNALSQGLIDMSKTIPVSADGLAKIAESAGALGVGEEYVLDFTRVVAGMAVATNLTADEAANAFARIASLTGLPKTQFENLGSTIVELGNQGASTEQEITSMALRMAAAGKGAGLSTPQIIGFASSLANTGIEAEAGGTAFSTFLQKMQMATALGGENLAEFGRVAGMTGADFKQAFETDASGAIQKFLVGLGQMSGTEKIVALKELELSEIKVADATKRLALTANDVVKTQADATRAFKENTALQTEVQKAYATTESRLKILGNNFADVARQIGTAMLPAINAMINSFINLAPVISGAVEKFKGLPDWVKIGAGIGVVSAALAGPLLLAFGTVATKIADVIKIWTLFSQTATGTALVTWGAQLLSVNGALGALGNSVPVLAARLALMDAGAKAAATGLLSTAGAAAATGVAAAIAGAALLKYGDDIRNLNDPVRDGVREVGLLRGAWILLGDAVKGAGPIFAALGKSISTLIQDSTLLKGAWEVAKVGFEVSVAPLNALKLVLENLAISASWLGDKFKALGDIWYSAKPGVFAGETQDLAKASSLAGKAVTDWGLAQLIIANHIKATTAAVVPATAATKAMTEEEKKGKAAADEKANALKRVEVATKAKEKADNAAEAATKAATATEKAHADAIRSTADALRGADVGKSIADLVKAWSLLSAEEQKNPAIIQNLTEKYESLRKSAIGPLPAELEKVRDAALRAAAAKDAAAQAAIRFGQAAMDLGRAAVRAAGEQEAWNQSYARLGKAMEAVSKQADSAAFAALLRGFEKIGGALQALPGLFGALGISANSTLSKMAQGAGDAAVSFGQMAAGIASQNYAQAIQGLTGVIAAVKSLVNSSSEASRALGGWLVAGPLGAIIAVLRKPEFTQVMFDVGRQWGVKISEGLAKAIAEDSRRIGDRYAATLLNLGAI
ncbi:MAG: phage tail tape measure protein, partial [Gemmatimonadales bacterium]|nr:phage tail tape measure protein [Gemmatimonadales bacterium]